MKNFKGIWLLVAAMSLLLIAACGGKKDDEQVSISITQTANVEAGKSTTLTVTFQNTEDTGFSVTLSPNLGSYKINGNKVTYTAPANVAAKTTVELTVTSTADPSKKSTAKITVVPPGGDETGFFRLPLEKGVIKYQPFDEEDDGIMILTFDKHGEKFRVDILSEDESFHTALVFNFDTGNYWANFGWDTNGWRVIPFDDAGARETYNEFIIFLDFFNMFDGDLTLTGAPREKIAGQDCDFFSMFHEDGNPGEVAISVQDSLVLQVKDDGIVTMRAKNVDTGKEIPDRVFGGTNKPATKVDWVPE